MYRVYDKTQYHPSEINYIGRQYIPEVRGLLDRKCEFQLCHLLSNGSRGSSLISACLSFVLCEVGTVPTLLNYMFLVNWLYAWHLRIVLSAH